MASKERQEITIIQSYLPAPVATEDLARVVAAVITETGASSLKDMGPVMKTVLARLAGQSVDGKIVSDLVKAALNR